MTTVPYVRHVEVAQSHLDEPAPVNTCVRLGMRAWAHELDLPVIPSDSVSAWEAAARRGEQGWRYVEGTDGIRAGYYGDWARAALQPTREDPDPRHVSVVEQLQGDRWRGIGAGTPSGKVALQPRSGGFNSLDVLRGYFIPPHERPSKTGPVKTQPAASTTPAATPAVRVHKVVKGDTVWDLARHYKVTQQAILKANPPLPSRRSADFHIASPRLILVGQRIRIP